MSARDVFSPKELAELRGFPEIGREELIRYFTLTAADEVFVRGKRSPATTGSVAQAWPGLLAGSPLFLHRLDPLPLGGRHPDGRGEVRRPQSHRN